MKKTWLIINPHSGGGKGLDQKKLILDKAAEMGWQGKYCEITLSKTGSMWVHEAIKAGVKQIIIGGGDGAVREVLKLVANENLSLGILPLGTGNVLARNLEIPLDIEQAIKVALHGKVKRIDLGEANGGCFGVMVSMGVDVAAVEKTKETIKEKWGVLAYLWMGMQSLAKRGSKYKVVIDNHEHIICRANSIVVANMARTVGRIVVAPGAGPQSGDLKVVIIRAKSIFSWINLLGNILIGKAKKSPYYKLYKAKKVEIYPLNGPRKFEVDGDELPPTDKLEIVIHPKALRVRVPVDNLGVT